MNKKFFLSSLQLVQAEFINNWNKALMTKNKGWRISCPNENR